MADPNKTILTGENPFIRLSAKDASRTHRGELLADDLFASWSGHVLYLKSELTERRWRIYSDNRDGRGGCSNRTRYAHAELSDPTIPCADAQFSKAGDPRTSGRSTSGSHGEEISLNLVSNSASRCSSNAQPNRFPTGANGVCTVLIPALGTRLVRTARGNGRSWPLGT